MAGLTNCGTGFIESCSARIAPAAEVAQAEIVATECQLGAALHHAAQRADLEGLRDVTNWSVPGSFVIQKEFRAQSGCL